MKLQLNEDGLACCPFCKESVRIVQRRSGWGMHWVECLDCDAQGPHESREALAIFSWNTRD